MQSPQNPLHTKVYPYYTRLWVEKHRKIKQGDVVVDAGAYLGGFAIYAAKKVGNKGKVISFEQDPKNFKKLKENINKSGLNNIILSNKALGSLQRRIQLESDNHFSSSIIKAGNMPVYTIGQVTLDNELERLGVKGVDVLKMNIEGAETGAIKGAIKTLKDASYVAISSHIVNGKHTVYDIEPMLRRLGFKTRIEKRIFKFTKHLDLYGTR